MTANNGPDSDLIFSLGMVFAAGGAQPLTAARQPPPAPPAPAELQPGTGANAPAPGRLGCRWATGRCNRQEAFTWDL